MLPEQLENRKEGVNLCSWDSLGMGRRVPTYALRTAGNGKQGVHLCSQDSWEEGGGCPSILSGQLGNGDATGTRTRTLSFVFNEQETVC